MSAPVRVRPRSWEQTLERRRIAAADGTGISYEVLGEGDKTIVLANGLGGRLYAWTPVIEAFWQNYRILTWDYRGLFASDSPTSLRRLTVPHHVEDLAAILDAEKVRAPVFFGWSMGVQVSLEFAANFPERVAGLVLLNGTYGHVFDTGFQPLFSIPFLPKRLHALVDWLQDHTQVAHLLARATRMAELPTHALMRVTAGSRAGALTPLITRYMDDVLGPSFPNYLRLFQELDAHSTYHLLRHIKAPALVVGGVLDWLTPVYQSRQIARRLADAEYLQLLRSSHFSLLERPEVVVPAMRRFLEVRARF